MPDQRIEPLNDAEQRWVAAELDNARRLVDLLRPDDSGFALTPDVLDRAYKAARGAADQNADAANAIINTVGIAFGQYLVDQLGFMWVAVFDNKGSEIGVVALPGTANVLVFPPNLVGKRWADGTVDFLSIVYKGIVDDLAKFQAEWPAQGANNRPLQRTGHAGKLPWFRRWFGRRPGN